MCVVGYRIKTYLEGHQSEQPSTSRQVVDQPKQCPQQATTSTAVVIPTTGWTSGFTNTVENGVAISRSFIYDYMVNHVSDGQESTNNFRTLKAGYNMFASGHVQSIHMYTVASHCFYKAVVLPSMKKDKTYTVLCAITLNSTKLDIVHCNCPAGESQSCVHLSALLHALERLFEAPRKAILVGTAVGESKTSLECMWVKPRKRKVPATCADTLHYVKHEYGRKRKRHSTDFDFDPRQPTKRNAATVEAGRQIFLAGLKDSGTCAELLL